MRLPSNADHVPNTVVSEEDLQALDFLIWFGAGRQAAEHAGTNQSTISRRATQVLAVFELNLKRQNGGYAIKGRNHDLLTMQRRVHQGRRLLGQGRLRLDGAAMIQPLLHRLSHPNWMLGSCERSNLDAVAALLRDHCLDAWLGPVPLGWSDHRKGTAWEGLQLTPLLEVPWKLCSRCRHPLATRPNLGIDDLISFPLLRLHTSDSGLPGSVAPGNPALTGLGELQGATQWPLPALGNAEQLPEDALMLAPSLSLLTCEDLSDLHLEPTQTLGPGSMIGLLVLEEHGRQPSILNLIEHLVDHGHDLQAQHPSLELRLSCPVSGPGSQSEGPS